MKALIIGATGATGRVLLPLLAASPAVERIDSYVIPRAIFAGKTRHKCELQKL